MEREDWSALKDWRHGSELADEETQSARIPQEKGMAYKLLGVGPLRSHRRAVFLKSNKQIVAWIHEEPGGFSVLIIPPKGSRRTAKPAHGKNTQSLKGCRQYVAERI